MPSLTPYYQRPGVTVYCGDCLDILPHLGQVDAVITDPPWGVGYVSHHNTRSFDDPLVRIDGNFSPITGDDHPFDPTHLLAYPRVILWGAQNYASRLPDSRGWLVWNKLDGKATFPSGSDCALAWTNQDMPIKMYTHLWRGIMRAGEENVVNGGKYHPNQKPVSLMQWCIQQIAPQGLIVDPYMGSGSTLVAAARMGYPVIGIEIEERYCEIAVKRLAQRSLFELMPAPAVEKG